MPTTPCRQTSPHETEKASWSVLRAELTRHGEHTHHIKAGHAWATAELSILHERLEAIEVLRDENHALKHGAASADELRETVVRLEAEVEAARAEPEVWCVSPFIPFRISGANLTGGIRARNAVSETPTMTPVSITQSLSALHLEHEHILEEHGADRPALHQREAELADARATAHAPLQAIRPVEDHRAPLRVAALAEREVGFLKAINVRSPLDCLLSLSSLGS
jgi:mitotic spindle assembly checkpoint protein MAD1